MIINFLVKNFKSIDDEISLSFEAVDREMDEYYTYKTKKDKILKIAMIYGANASGKTNILRALDFLVKFILNAPQQRDKTITITPFLFTDNIKENSYFELEFLVDDIKYFYQLELSSTKVINERLYYYNPNKALIFDRLNFKFGSKIKISKLEREVLFNSTLKNNSLLSGYLKTNINIKEFDNAIKWFKKVLPPIFPKIDLTPFVLDTLEKKKLDKLFILDILKNADFEIDDYDIQESEIEDNDIKKFLDKIGKSDSGIKKLEIFFTHLKKYRLEYNNESSGTQRYYQLSIMLTLLLKESLILPIDELESSLHPDLLKHFILSFLVNSKKSQLIFTTHSRELLLEKDMLRQDTIWFTQKNKKGATELFSVSDFDTKTIRRESSLYNAYKSGKFGAVPNLKDYFLDI